MNDLALSVTKRLVLIPATFCAFLLTTSVLGGMPKLTAQPIPGQVASGETTLAQNRVAAPAATLAIQPLSVRRQIETADQYSAESIRVWKRSLIPLAVSQTLDITSSYGMRELNPMLAGADGRFGQKAIAIKAATTGAIVGVEYLIVKKWPKAGRVLSKLNWASSFVSAGLAVHNYAIK